MAKIELNRNQVVIDFGLLLKLGSIVVHAEEMLSPNGHEFDRMTINSLLGDSDVKKWIAEMGVYLPKKR